MAPRKPSILCRVWHNNHICAVWIYCNIHGSLGDLIRPQHRFNPFTQKRFGEGRIVDAASE
jgi:hypothetical protein